MEGMLTHIAQADCFIAQPHAAAACGIVTAWWDQVQTGAGATPNVDVVMEMPKLPR
jgi:hypothetical protein